MKLLPRLINRKNITAVLLGAGLSLLGVANTWSEGEGTSGAPFLKIGTSSRAEAMGGAFTAVANDVDSIYWNPAGLMQLKRSTLGFTHLEWFQDIRYEYISYADKFETLGAIGIGLGYLYLGNIPKTFETPTGDYDELNSNGFFGASDVAINFAWGGSFAARENRVGVGVKIIQESIDQNQSFSVGLDLGDQLLLSRMAWYRKLEGQTWVVNLVPSVIGLSIKNLGMPVKYFSQSDPLPVSGSFGLAYKFLDEDLTAAIDFVYYTVESEFTTQVGLEYWIATGLESDPNHELEVGLRGGYRNGYEASSAPGFSLGAGLRYAAIGLDYVYMPFGDLGITHRVSLKYSWGDILKDKTAAKHRKVKKTQTALEQTYQDTADKMVESKKSMEEKVVVQKSPDNKAAQTLVEAKKPETQAVVKETKTLGADMQKITPVEETKGAKGTSSAILKGSETKIDTSLIAKITQSNKEAQSARTQTKYNRRTQEDAARAARHEAEVESQAFDSVEAAAKAEAQSREGEKDKWVTKTTIYFAPNSGQLNDKYLFALDKIAVAFDHFSQRTILVHGYTSADEQNKKELSFKRAQAVKDYLVQIKSIANNKISVKGFEDKDPAADNDTEANRARNRRVRVQIIQTGN